PPPASECGDRGAIRHTVAISSGRGWQLEPKVTMRDRARFVPPAPPAAAVPLQRLDSHYEAATGRVLRVLAPGGYGKSTQTARWVAGEPRAVGWVDLERVDNDP